MKSIPSLFLTLTLLTSIMIPVAADVSRAEPVIPSTWDIVTENFESGSLDSWTLDNQSSLSLLAGGGHNGSTGLALALGRDTAFIYQSHVARAEEGYLNFWFNPNGAVIPNPFTYWPPENGVCIASVVSTASDWWPPMISLYVLQNDGGGYKGFLTWPKGSSNFYDYADGQFDLASGWQKITLGYRIDAWAAIWVNDILVRYSTDVDHEDAYGDVIELGKINSNSAITPSGSLRFDDFSFQTPRVDNLWVDAVHGDDAHDGLSAEMAFRTIQKAANYAGPGTTVHILPGVYRETVSPAQSGSAAEAALYRSEHGLGTATLRGSEPSSSLTWTALTENSIGLPSGVDLANIFVADVSGWALEAAPRFIVQLDASGEISSRLPLAREPDWNVTTEWKTHEFWWAADGGSSPATCDPATDSDANCDVAQRSITQLTDRTNDSEPAGIEAGNLTSLGDLTGATLVAIDTLQGHYVYRRLITAHDVVAGKVTVDEICEHDGGTGVSGLGWGSKYYVENKPRLLDTPGEWWYDSAAKKLYLWPLNPGNPSAQRIEISVRENGFSLKNRSYTTLDGLAIELVNQSAVHQVNWTAQKSYHNTVRNVRLRYANYGVHIEQDVNASAPVGNVIDGFTLEDSELAYIDTNAIRLIDWWENGAAPASFSHSGVLNTVIRNNEMHHLGFRTDGDNAVGVSFTFANKLRFEGNHIHHVAHNGVQISESVIQSSKEYGFAPSEIKTGDILILNNIFERACQLTTDCGGLKFWGSPPDNHVFRNVLVSGNIFRDSYGWTYVSEKRHRWTGGQNSAIRGLGGFGLYVDHASGIHAYRNISYNNAYTDYMLYGVYRDGDIVYYNNIAANSLIGISLGGSQYDTHGATNTQVVNNIFVNNESYAVSYSNNGGNTANTIIDHNLYFQNGWRPFDYGGDWKPGAMIYYDRSDWLYFPSLDQVRLNTPFETNGREGDPLFWSYDAVDHELHDGSWPDFHLQPGSPAIDGGTAALPESLTALLKHFNVPDAHWSAVYDAGRYESGFALQADPVSQVIEPGGSARYTLSLFPTDLPFTVDLAAPSPAATLALTLSPAAITADVQATLSITDTAAAPGAASYTIPVSASGGGFSASLDLSLFIGGTQQYLPLVIEDSP